MPCLTKLLGLLYTARRLCKRLPWAAVPLMHCPGKAFYRQLWAANPPLLNTIVMPVDVNEHGSAVPHVLFRWNAMGGAWR